ncbi:hypothetical protein ACOME3_003068 [Neoechinorhynchus agilis]
MDHHHDHHMNPSPQPLMALLATFGISLFPFLILFAMPKMGIDHDSPTLRYLLQFAAGSLLGDAFIHLIPHALSEASEHQDFERIGMLTFSGVLIFAILEMVASHLVDHKKESSKLKKDKDSDDEDFKSCGEPRCTPTEPEVHKTVDVSGVHKTVDVSGYLSLLADFSHNFTDGLAMGASFMVTGRLGLVTSLAVLLHEIPHELGDYALLVRSGIKPINAIYLQLVTAIGAFLGCILAIFAGNEVSINFVLPITAGGFIYSSGSSYALVL